MTHNAYKKLYHDMQEEEKEANANGEFFLNSLATPDSTPVSYTHLTLPTNREV